MTASNRAPGVREAVIVGAVTVVIVLAIAFVTLLLPANVSAIVFRTPLLIVVLIVGTVGVLWRITRPGP